MTREEPLETSRIARAFALADSLHQDQTRKGGGAPYITHLMAVAALVGEHGGAENLIIAALLHDAVEDQGGPNTLVRIRAGFGDDVANIVEACSDTDQQPKPPWRERKESHIARIAKAGPDVKLVYAADKLHNARCLLRDLRREGHALWGRFKGGRDGTLWYLEASLEALATGWDHVILVELRDAVGQLVREGGSE